MRLKSTNNIYLNGLTFNFIPLGFVLSFSLWLNYNHVTTSWLTFIDMDIVIFRSIYLHSVLK